MSYGLLSETIKKKNNQGHSERKAVLFYGIDFPENQRKNLLHIINIPWNHFNIQICCVLNYFRVKTKQQQKPNKQQYENPLINLSWNYWEDGYITNALNELSCS